jgi:Fe-S-cluster containining protein
VVVVIGLSTGASHRVDRTEPACTGACCAVFAFLDPSVPRFSTILEAEYLADMLIPLDLMAAAERLERPGIDPPADGGEAHYDWDGRVLDNPERRLMTCRHWDETARLCTAYDQRPRMCRDYPYYGDNGGKACDYGCGFTLDHQAAWDNELLYNGPEAGTPPNIIRGSN